MKSTIVVLDGKTLVGDDLEWTALNKLGDTIIYSRTSREQVVSRLQNADLAVVNKVVLGKHEFEQLPRLRGVVVTATGLNNIDLEEADARGIPVLNAAGYSVRSVGQHVFAFLLNQFNQITKHHEWVSTGKWQQSLDFSYTLQSIPSLAGKTMGIIGFGDIGKHIANLALVFGMRVLVNTRSAQKYLAAYPDFAFVSREDLLGQSDIVSLHCSLTEQTRHLINDDSLGTMKTSAILINTGRGELIDEPALAHALKNGKISHACLDVLSKEPPSNGNVLIGLPNCTITPHIAWASHQARAQLMKITIANVQKLLSVIE